jgi:hypothetical protein
MKSDITTKYEPWPRNQEHRARIQWLAPHEGGRRKPPTIPEYRGVSRFDVDPNHVHGFWDVVVRFEKFPTEDDLESIAYVSFLSPEAPQEFLRAGCSFEVMEGLKTVARGVALE